MKLADIWQNLPPARLVEALFAIENINIIITNYLTWDKNGFLPNKRLLSKKSHLIVFWRILRAIQRAYHK